MLVHTWFINLQFVKLCVCVSVRMHTHVCVHVCADVCVCVCTCMRVCLPEAYV